jgi:hypothetical protein
MILCNIWCIEQLIRHVNCCNIFLCDAWNLRTSRFEPSAKKHLLFFSCFLKKNAPSTASLIKLCFPKFTLCLRTFSFKYCRSLLHIQSFCRWCNTMYDVMLCEMMRWYDAIWWWCRTHTHTPTLEHTRLCISLWTSLESLSSASP